MKNYTWKKNESYWELVPAKGYLGVAFIQLIDGKWEWSVNVPRQFSVGANPRGTTKSLQAAKALCEAIVKGWTTPKGKKGTVAPSVDRNTNDQLFEIPFKHGRAFGKPGERESFEKLLDFTFPDDLLASYGNWNGGGIEGAILFDTPVCRQMATSKFLSLIKIAVAEDRFKDSVLTEIRTNHFLKGQAIKKVQWIPFAIVDGSYDPDEETNSYNCRSNLVFERTSKAISMLSGYDGKVVRLSDSWSEFIKSVTWVEEN